jgi:hypothetical protein
MHGDLNLRMANDVQNLDWVGDGMSHAGWLNALRAAMEYAKREFGFGDIVITGIRGEENRVE